ncbi:hypothetical protein BP6252_08446 [Coleophoma cylindrospora]|uniref:Uncharacterized protein n=1 Tax=Coleophoma cylindrospora TaxID=1849047 RepID=A0A3D8R5Z7_9HELO|nr:hypothetical protein BP6252_08446 [Coleophoma cylindrospora]
MPSKSRGAVYVGVTRPSRLHHPPLGPGELCARSDPASQLVTACQCMTTTKGPNGAAQPQAERSTNLRPPSHVLAHSGHYYQMDLIKAGRSFCARCRDFRGQKRTDLIKDNASWHHLNLTFRPPLGHERRSPQCHTQLCDLTTPSVSMRPVIISQTNDSESLMSGGRYTRGFRNLNMVEPPHQCLGAPANATHRESHGNLQACYQSDADGSPILAVT